MRLRVSLAFLLVALAGVEAAPESSPSALSAAVALFKEKQYPAARAALENIVAAEPKNAAACYYLGRTLELRAVPDALADALRWYEQTLALEPNNTIYLARYGGASLQFASRTSSLSAARKGRDALEKALTLNPDDLDAREGLMQFYQRAPWPLGSSAKAAAQLEEIRRRDPTRATTLSILNRANAKDYEGAFQLCDEVLAQNPDNYVALYHYGRTADVCGKNLARGLASLQRCLALPPPSPASPSHADVWRHIGNLEARQQHVSAARDAYESALRLDPGNKQAADALGRLTP